MKYFASVIALVFSLFLFNCSEKKVEVSEEQLIGMRTTAMDFMKDLKGVLINQIQTNGVLQAVSVCSDTAQVLTNNFGVQKGVFIRRVSFKNRNENNFPDDFEKKVLKKFELLHQNKELNNETEHAEIVQEGEFKYLRYMKPILVQAECLNCHGSEADIMPEVKQLIAQEYSSDKAVGYKIGDLRGAVSVKKVIQ
ncbi:MAG: DUF3365 domain-containing protein [Ignavibacteriaceae bacterium]|nr:DUF3365 domain-containing protein [Ignavibacteriaceae bacterium]